MRGPQAVGAWAGVAAPVEERAWGWLGNVPPEPMLSDRCSTWQGLSLGVGSLLHLPVCHHLFGQFGRHLRNDCRLLCVTGDGTRPRLALAFVASRVAAFHHLLLSLSGVSLMCLKGESLFDAKAFGENLMLRRRRRDWSQLRLAEATGLSQVTIGRIERGEIPNLSVDTMLRLAAALGVPVAQLLPAVPTGNSESNEDEDTDPEPAHAA